MKLLSHLTFLLLIFNFFFVIGAYEEETKPYTLTPAAMDPVLHLFNSKLYLHEGDYRGSKQLAAAIEKIKSARRHIHDAKSMELVNSILPELEVLHGQMEEGDADIHEVNANYVKMLLALSYLQVQHALESVDDDGPHNPELIHSLQKGMYVIKKALILSDGTKRDYEVDIYSGMNDIVRERIHDPEEIRQTLREALADIEDLEVSF